MTNLEEIAKTINLGKGELIKCDICESSGRVSSIELSGMNGPQTIAILSVFRAISAHPEVGRVKLGCIDNKIVRHPTDEELEDRKNRREEIYSKMAGLLKEQIALEAFSPAGKYARQTLTEELVTEAMFRMLHILTPDSFLEPVLQRKVSDAFKEAYHLLR